MEIKKVGVVGCGLMGSGIALACAQSGYDVVVSEINDELLNKGLALINSNLTKSVEKGKISQADKDSALARIKGTTNIKDFGDRDLIIEAAIEKMEPKKKIFAELDKICPADTILASNSSALSILEMAVATSRPDKVLGLHFFSPAHIMKLVEVVRTIVTSDEIVETGRKFAESLGKTPVITKDTPGFITNRLMASFWANAINLLDSGVATKEGIDTAVQLGLNHPMGPLALADAVGLDIVLALIEAVYEEIREQQYVPPILLKKMVTAGLLGRKTGKGFYEYK